MNSGKTQYKKLLLDTNIISNIAKNIDGLGIAFIDRFIAGGEYLICITPSTILELKEAERAYEASKALFKKLPCLITTTAKGILEKEVNQYYSDFEVDPILFGAASVNVFLSYEDVMHIFETDSQLREIIDSEQDKFKDVLSEWSKKRSDASEYFKKMGITNYNEQCTIINEGFKKDFFKTMKRDIQNDYPDFSGEIKVSKFPSMALIEFCLLNKIYLSKQRLDGNDVNDIIITGIVPYVDAVITEKQQANLFKQAKGKDYLKNIEIYTISDIQIFNCK